MQNLNLLLIEDNPADAFLIKEMLNPEGKGDYCITHSPDLRESLRLISENKFDFIISDLGLPDSYGLDTVKSVIKKTSRLPVIVLTGNDNEETGNEALSLGAQDYLIKGTINPDQLHRSIHYAYMRKKTETRLLESEEKFRATVEISPDAVLILDVYMKIVYASMRALEIYGFSKRGSLLGKGITELFPENEKHKIQTLFKELFKTGVVRDLELMMLREGRKGFYGELSASVVKNEDDLVDGYIIVAKDITLRKSNENAIKTYQQSLRSLVTQLNLAEEKERRKIAVDLHDHLGQSLAMAKIRLSALKNGNSGAPQAENLKEAERHISHAIEFSRILTYELSPPVLFELGITEAIKWKLGQLSEKFGIKSSLKITGEIPSLQDDSSILVFRSFNELIDNIAKHSKAQKVSVIAKIDEQVIILEVEDDGIGFNPQMLKKNSYKSNKMGLFSIRERLKHFQGELFIDSAEGKGAKIKLSVPVITK